MFAALHRRPMPVARAMELAGITDIAGQKTTKLSGGQSQRVRYALALVPDPDLLVLDEPTVAMDVEVRRSFWASMREFTASGRTVLFATHYLEEADDFADRVVVLAERRHRRRRHRCGDQGVGRRADRSRRSSPARTRRSSCSCPGSATTDQQGQRMLLHCNDSDTALRALLAALPGRPRHRDQPPAISRTRSSS